MQQLIVIEPLPTILSVHGIQDGIPTALASMYAATSYFILATFFYYYILALRKLKLVSSD